MSKRRVRPCVQRKSRPILKLEHLETRNLLAADFGIELTDSGSDAPKIVVPEIESTSDAAIHADVNADGIVTPTDALMVLNAMHEGTTVEDNTAVDVNLDGVVTALDALLVLNAMPRNGEANSDGGLPRHKYRGQSDPPGPGRHESGPRPEDGPDARRPGGHPGGPAGGPGVEPGGNTNGTSFIRSIDGTDNNRWHEKWGAADEELLRISANEYGDDESTPAGADRASAREISNVVAAQTESVENDRGLSDLLWQWGQFLDHDIDITDGSDPAEDFSIDVPTGDPLFDPFGTGEEQINLGRSAYEVDENGIRQQVNGITAFIDGSNVYGSDEERAAALRSLAGGKLLTSEGNLLPFNVDGLDNAGGTSDTLFLAGDVRANEQIGLTAMHTLWVREHNRIAEQLAEHNPNTTDEQLYQRARAIVIGEMQAITYNEFLPALLGRGVIDAYDGYDRDVNPGITNEFSTAAYRFGHSMLSTELLRLNNDRTEAEEGNISLQDAFFNPHQIIDNGIDSLLLGLSSQTAQEIDTMVVDDIRNFLFGPPGAGGFDLASLNIQRGRDHGLADYKQVRSDLGLDPVQTFADISSDPDVQAALEAAYGTVGNIDLWVGGLAEDHSDGASVGELVKTILVDQFTRLRDGDSFWYERIFHGQELRRINNSTLAEVIERNTDVEGLQDNVFFSPDAIQNPLQSNLAIADGIDSGAVTADANSASDLIAPIELSHGASQLPSGRWVDAPRQGVDRVQDRDRGGLRSDRTNAREPRFTLLDAVFADLADV